MFCGSWTALVTPFKNGQFDQLTFEKQIEFQAKNGTAGIVPVGTTGESPTLSYEEHDHVIEVAIKAARGTGMKVLAGTGSNSTEETISLSQHAKKAGADGVLLVNPYYNKPSQEGMYQHFKTVAGKVDLPIVLYNIPGRTGINMSIATMTRLAKECKNIVGMKDAAGDLNLTSEIVMHTGLAVLSGDDSLCLPMMSVGAGGVISVATNIIPKQVSTMVNFALNNNFADALKIHQKYLELFKGLFVEGNPVGIKMAMHLLGRDTGELRLPLYHMSDANRDALKGVLTRAELLG